MDGNKKQLYKTYVLRSEVSFLMTGTVDPGVETICEDFLENDGQKC